jgi:polyhydroxybutyrate depolymerase
LAVKEPRAGRRPSLAAIVLLGVAVAIVAVVLVVAINATSKHVPSAQASAGTTITGTTTAGSTTTAATESFTIIGPRPAPIVYRPPGLGLSRKVPLVVAFYGATGTPQAMEGLTKFEELARTYGFVVAYPGSQTNPPWHGPDDVQYMNALIARVRASENIDPKRIYLTGFSAGGRETYFLGCRLSRVVAAIAVVSSVMRDYPCTVAHAISEVTIAGSTEAVNGSSSGVPSAAAVAARWRAFDGCPTQAPVQRQVATVTEQTWGSCRSGSAVGIWIVQGGHHTWPGTYGLAPSDPDAQFNASKAIWAFFAAHPLLG